MKFTKSCSYIANHFVGNINIKTIKTISYIIIVDIIYRLCIDRDGIHVYIEKYKCKI